MLEGRRGSFLGGLGNTFGVCGPANSAQACPHPLGSCSQPCPTLLPPPLPTPARSADAKYAMLCQITRSVVLSTLTGGFSSAEKMTRPAFDLTSPA